MIEQDPNEEVLETDEPWAQVVLEEVSDNESLIEEDDLESDSIIEIQDEDIIETESAEIDQPDVEQPPVADSDSQPNLDSDPTEIQALIAERDQYLNTSRRIQAEFENYKKQVVKREADSRARANDGLVSELLLVLDACDGAVNNGVKDVGPIRASLFETLSKQGLERIAAEDQLFDPEQHEAVMHEESQDGSQAVVVECLRNGYMWKGRVIRPAMVRVKG